MIRIGNIFVDLCDLQQVRHITLRRKWLRWWQLSVVLRDGSKVRVGRFKSRAAALASVAADCKKKVYSVYCVPFTALLAACAAPFAR